MMHTWALLAHTFPKRDVVEGCFAFMGSVLVGTCPLHNILRDLLTVKYFTSELCARRDTFTIARRRCISATFYLSAMLTLLYFPVPVRAEPFRIMLKIAGDRYDDVTFSEQDWAANYKPLACGQCPLLKLPDGDVMCKSLAINKYGASLAGFMPQDPLEVARTLEIAVCCDEVRERALKLKYNCTSKSHTIAA